MKRYQVQFQGASRVKALMDTDDRAAAEACRDSQAPDNGWVVDTQEHPEEWIA